MSTKILIVEDLEIISTQLRYFLESNNYECMVCRSGEHALEIAGSFLPDLILMDIKLLGKLDGIETTKKIKEFTEAPVIYLTSFMDTSVIERAVATEPYGFISKNISHTELKVQIEFALLKYAKDIENINFTRSLKNNGDIYESIFDTSRDAIFFVDKNCEISFWNKTAERIFGWEKDEAVGRKLFELIINEDDKDEFKESYQSWMSAQQPDMVSMTLELMSIRKNGAEFPIEMSLALVEHKSERAVCGFVRDVSEKVIAEEEISKLIEEMQISKETIEQNASELVVLNSKLSESEQLLTDLNASKDKLFSIIAHDLKGPFQGLLGYSQILSNDIKHLSFEEISEVANNLNDAALHLFKLLENLLNWSRLQRGTFEYKPINFDILYLIEQNMGLIKARTEQKSIKASNKVKDSHFVFADINMVNTVLRNLLSNAVKFTPEGGQIGVELHADKHKTEICIFDTGVGMDENAIQNLFKIDGVYTTPGTNDEQGTGLGLLLCKDLVEKNNGILKVESQIGKGSCFTFTLDTGSDQEFV